MIFVGYNFYNMKIIVFLFALLHCKSHYSNSKFKHNIIKEGLFGQNTIASYLAEIYIENKHRNNYFIILI